MSSITRFVVFIVVVDPLTVKLPLIATSARVVVPAILCPPVVRITVVSAIILPPLIAIPLPVLTAIAPVPEV